MLGGLDDLVKTFSKVEFFLGTFPEDTNVTKASISLVVSTFEATEKVIGFFTSNECKSGISPLAGEKDLVQMIYQFQEVVKPFSREKTNTKKPC